ncbi:RNA-directed DNA polymerase [Striga asiatica]|uniref:RNA-directed DNA polymerase n=1 Tax=Striga asiatica TaxID=4170 RepID=A0A5A7QKK5_STRAF|nr:RNA-directed DNA polymerase [Striga asiatica]
MDLPSSRYPVFCFQEKIQGVRVSLLKWSCHSLDDTVLQGVNKMITENMNTGLTATVEEEEIRDALFSISPHKAPGQDAKETLLKVVLEAVPLFAISFFILPKMVYIAKLFADFWWKTKNEGSGGIHRKSWTLLPKEKGGLGFHDIHHMNKALPRPPDKQSHQGKIFPQDKSDISIETAKWIITLVKIWEHPCLPEMQNLRHKPSNSWRNTITWLFSPSKGLTLRARRSSLGCLANEDFLQWLRCIYIVARTQVAIRKLWSLKNATYLQRTLTPEGFFGEEPPMLKSVFVLLNSQDCPPKAARTCPSVRTQCMCVRSGYRHYHPAPMCSRHVSSAHGVVDPMICRLIDRSSTTPPTALSKKIKAFDTFCKSCGAGEEFLEHLMFHCSKSRTIWKLATISWDGLEEYSSSFKQWWIKLCSLKACVSIDHMTQLSVYLIWWP